jgi:hypothetical protein
VTAYSPVWAAGPDEVPFGVMSSEATPWWKTAVSRVGVAPLRPLQSLALVSK